jgi:hypothetical protein
LNHPTTLFAMPRCAGGEYDTGPCKIRPDRFLIGTANFGDGAGLGYAAACPIHYEEIHGVLSIPNGCLETEYTQHAWESIRRELEQDEGAWELRWGSAG